MNLENKVRQQLLSRGFTKEQLLNNRGLIGAVIDETALSVYKALITSAYQMTDRAIKYIQIQGQNLPIQNVVRSGFKVIEIGTKVQMTKRKWWQIYRKGWHKHNDHWGRKWWIRYNWNA